MIIKLIIKVKYMLLVQDDHHLDITRTIIPKTVVRAAPSVVRNARERSLGVRGAHIFNLLPENLRSTNTNHVDLFKNHLDVFLSSIPDQPTVTGLGRAAESNSLLHQLPMFYTQTV